MDRKSKEEPKEEDKLLKIGPDLIHKNHHFRYKNGTEVECDCGVGYQIAYGMKLVDGHIEYEGSLVI